MTKLLALAFALALVLTGCAGQPAHESERTSAQTNTTQEKESTPVIASDNIEVIYDRPDISSEAPKKVKKEKKPETTVAAQKVEPVAKPAPVAAAPEPKPKPVPVAAPAPITAPEPVSKPIVQPQPKPKPQAQAQPVTKPAPQPVQQVAEVASTGSSTVAAVARGQQGVAQDCTALVEKSLRAAGVQGVGDESPASLRRFGTPTSSPQPGDMIYYADGGAGVPHIAIYAGGGQAVHGGWNGFSTAIAPANIGSGPVYYSVN